MHTYWNIGGAWSKPSRNACGGSAAGSTALAGTADVTYQGERKHMAWVWAFQGATMLWLRRLKYVVSWCLHPWGFWAQKHGGIPAYELLDLQASHMNLEEHVEHILSSQVLEHVLAQSSTDARRVDLLRGTFAQTLQSSDFVPLCKLWKLQPPQWGALQNEGFQRSALGVRPVLCFRIRIYYPHWNNIMRSATWGVAWGVVQDSSGFLVYSGFNVISKKALILFHIAC